MNNSELRKYDIAILLFILSKNNQSLNYRKIVEGLGISLSSVSAGVARCRRARLLDSDELRVMALSLEEFLVYGMQYAFPLQVGRVVRGVPTYVSAPPINKYIISGDEEFVWPSANGTVRGHKIEPLFPKASELVLQDVAFYELLVIADTLRIGRVREREIAKQLLHQIIIEYGKN